MGLAKRVAKSENGQRVLAWLAAQYVRFVAATTRWRVDDAALRRVTDIGEPGILAFWHGRLLMMPVAWKGRPRPFHMMISEHRDGALIARTIAHMSIRTTGTDSKNGGLAALREMKRRMDDGGWVGITPDGPRGPRMRAKPGAIKLSQLAGRPIVPVSLGMSRRRLLGTWDRFMVAWPFGRGTIIFGEPIRVPRITDTDTLDRLRAELEDRLNDLTARADAHCGVARVDPAAEDALAVAADPAAEAQTPSDGGDQARA
jgi:lysophospholipid acyltransferase (LPLAT)-like uncharacterized protein